MALAALAILAVVAIALRPAPVPVELGSVGRGDLRGTVDEEGKTRIRDRFVVSAPATGWLQRVRLKEGDAVREGDVVARLEPLPLDERTRAEVESPAQGRRGRQQAAEARVRQNGTSLSRPAQPLARGQAGRGGAAGLREEREQVELAEASLARELDAARFSARAAAFEAEAARATLVAGAPGRPDRSEGAVIALRSPGERPGPSRAAGE